MTDTATYTNEAWSDGFQILDANGDPVDLTGADLRLMVRVADDAVATLLSLTVGAGITITVPTEGQFVVDVAKATMEAIAPGVYPFDVVMVSGAVWTRLFGGDLAVGQGVTR